MWTDRVSSPGPLAHESDARTSEYKAYLQLECLLLKKVLFSFMYTFVFLLP